MTLTDKMFKFPMRLYNDNDDTKWVRGWKKIFFEDIVDIGDDFYSSIPVDEVIETGFKSSLIGTTKCTYPCDWPLNFLERKLNSHISRVKEYELSLKETTPLYPIKSSPKPLEENSADNIALNQ